MRIPQAALSPTAIAATTLVLAAVCGLTALSVRDPLVRVQVRNGILADVGEPADFSWPGHRPPDGFLLDTSVPDDFAAVARKLVAEHPETTPFERALILASHLASDPYHKRRIQSDTRSAYHGIVSEGRGNCSDVSQVYNGLATASDLPVREWGMYLDSFGGFGHAFNEIYDTSRGDWVMIDAHHSFYPTLRETGEPLSVSEFREHLSAGADLERLDLVPIVPERFGSHLYDEQELYDYYRNNLERSGLWYGNGVFSYDDNPWVAATGKLSRTLEQLSAIIIGAHPRLKIVPTDGNADAIAEMYRVRNRFLLGLAVSAALLGVWITQLTVLFGRRRSEAATSN